MPQKEFFTFTPPEIEVGLDVDLLLLQVRDRILDNNFASLKHTDTQLKDILDQELFNLCYTQEIFIEHIQANLQEGALLHIEGIILKILRSSINNNLAPLLRYEKNKLDNYVLMHGLQEFSINNLRAGKLDLVCVFGVGVERAHCVPNIYFKALIYMLIARIFEANSNPNNAQKILFYKELLKKELDFLRALKNGRATLKTTPFKGVV